MTTLWTYAFIVIDLKSTKKTGIHTQTNAEFSDDSMAKEKEQSQGFKEMNLLWNSSIFIEHNKFLLIIYALYFLGFLIFHLIWFILKIHFIEYIYRIFILCNYLFKIINNFIKAYLFFHGGTLKI